MQKNSKIREIIKIPQECTHEEISLFEALVLEGAEVQAKGLRKRIELAYRLIFIELQGECVSIGALKCPNSSYKSRVFSKSGVIESTEDYQYELGYLYTSPSSRGKGIGSILMKAVSKALNGNSCFATTREDNKVMHYLFEKASFVKLGVAYKSERGDYSIGLFANS